jgi:hypothetical protein
LGRCYNKFLEIDRSTVTTGDYQRVKITELDEVSQREASAYGVAQQSGDMAAAVAASAARVPRTIEVEVRDTLVNTCVPGDLLCVVGVVKAAQVRFTLLLRVRGVK